MATSDPSSSVQMSGAMMKKHDIEYDAGFSADRQQLVWKGALLLLCAGIFALILWSGGHDNRNACTLSRAASREACVTEPKSETLRPPAKGAFAPAHWGFASRISA
jgi:hypothetical protein